MPLVLTKRASNGGPVTADQNDTNMTNIESAVNANTSAIAGISAVSISTFNNAFSGFSGSKGNIDWANVIFTPSNLANPSMCRIELATAPITVSSSGSVTQVTFNNSKFNINGIYDLSTHRISAPYAGIYSLGASVQLSLASGSPTGVSCIIALRLNGATNIEEVTIDGVGTGTTIYKIPTLYKLASGDHVDVTVDLSWTGSATWSIDDNANTNFWAHYVQPAA